LEKRLAIVMCPTLGDDDDDFCYERLNWKPPRKTTKYSLSLSEISESCTDEDRRVEPDPDTYQHTRGVGSHLILAGEGQDIASVPLSDIEPLLDVIKGVHLWIVLKATDLTLLGLNHDLCMHALLERRHYRYLSASFIHASCTCV
jgi:hypothetical protein